MRCRVFECWAGFGAFTANPRRNLSSEVGWFPFKIWWQFEAAIPDHTLPDPGEREKREFGVLGLAAVFEGSSRERLSALVV